MSTIKSGLTTSQLQTYYGPNNGGNYALLGSVSVGETVTHLWSEGTWSYIRYRVGTTSTYKCGYILKESVNIVETTYPAVKPSNPSSSSKRYCLRSNDIYAGGPTGFAYFKSVTLSTSAEVDYLGFKLNGDADAFVEYTSGAQKYRGFCAANNLTTVKPTKEIGIRPVGTSFKTNDYPNYPNGSYHGGTDIGATQGGNVNDLVKASFAGKIVGVVNTFKPGEGTSYGNNVVIESTINGIKYRVWYAHLNTVIAGIKLNDIVSKGQVIGYLGNTGNCQPQSYAHTHLEYRKEPYRWTTDNVDPKIFY